MIRNSPLTSLASTLFSVLGALMFCAVSTVSAQTIAIPGLYATGVGLSGNLLADNRVDPHYVVTAIPGSAPIDNFGNARTVSASAKPNDWVSNTSTARWITTPGTATEGGGAGGNNTKRVTGEFDYTLTFTMPAGVMLSTATITGSGWADDSATIYLNGSLVSGQSTGSFYGSAGSFTLNNTNATFLSGTNTITFRVNNSGGGPTGLLINSLSGTVAVPEVGTILPIFGALAIYGLVVARRRSSRQTATA